MISTFVFVLLALTALIMQPVHGSEATCSYKNVLDARYDITLELPVKGWRDWCNEKLLRMLKESCAEFGELYLPWDEVDRSSPRFQTDIPREEPTIVGDICRLRFAVANKQWAEKLATPLNPPGPVRCIPFMLNCMAIEHNTRGPDDCVSRRSSFH